MLDYRGSRDSDHWEVSVGIISNAGHLVSFTPNWGTTISVDSGSSISLLVTGITRLIPFPQGTPTVGSLLIEELECDLFDVTGTAGGASGILSLASLVFPSISVPTSITGAIPIAGTIGALGAVGTLIPVGSGSATYPGAGIVSGSGQFNVNESFGAVQVFIVDPVSAPVAYSADYVIPALSVGLTLPTYTVALGGPVAFGTTIPITANVLTSVVPSFVVAWAGPASVDLAVTPNVVTVACALYVSDQNGVGVFTVRDPLVDLDSLRLSYLDLSVDAYTPVGGIGFPNTSRRWKLRLKDSVMLGRYQSLLVTFSVETDTGAPVILQPFIRAAVTRIV